MALNKKQKKFISRNFREMPIGKIANLTGAKEDEIVNYLKKLGKLNDLERRTKAIAGINFLGIRALIKKYWVILSIILFGTILLYLNSLNGAFVSDDYATIIQNQEVTNFGAMSQQLALSTWANWLLAVVFGPTKPFPYHLFSLLLYLAVCVFVFVLLKILMDEEIAVLSTIIFALMPIHVESVSWISGKPYLFNALFVLFSMIVTILYLQSGKMKYFWSLLVAIPLLFLADKVRSFAYIFLMILAVISFKNINQIKFKWSKLLLMLAPFLFVGVAYLWPKIIERVDSVNSGYNSSESIFYNPFFQYPTAIAKYLQLAVFPTDLTLYHTMYVFPTWLNWMITLSFLVLVGYFFFKDKRLFFGLTLMFAAAAPSMSPVKVSWLVAERYMFLGSLGMALVLGVIFREAIKRNKYLPTILLGCLLIYYGISVYKRNVDWQTNHNLWVRTVQVSPNSHNAWNNIGDDYDKLAQYENAIKGFTQSTIVKPNYADAYHNRANIFYKIGRLDLARESYETALSYSPGLYQTYISLIQIDLTEKRFIEAMNNANKLVNSQPENLQFRYVKAIVAAQMGMLDEAKKEIKLMLSMDPNNVSAKDLLMKVEGLNSEKSINSKPTK